jgi:hypothetical protein
MNDEFPVGFLGFNSDFEFSESCSFCADFSLDVLELFIHGKIFVFSLQLNSVHVHFFG